MAYLKKNLTSTAESERWNLKTWDCLFIQQIEFGIYVIIASGDISKVCSSKKRAVNIQVGGGLAAATVSKDKSTHFKLTQLGITENQ